MPFDTPTAVGDQQTGGLGRTEDSGTRGKVSACFRPGPPWPAPRGRRLGTAPPADQQLRQPFPEPQSFGLLALRAQQRPAANQARLDGAGEGTSILNDPELLLRSPTCCFWRGGQEAVKGGGARRRRKSQRCTRATNRLPVP